MTEPAERQAQCRHCGKLIQYAAAPAHFRATGYFGYWYHPHVQHKLCQPDRGDSTEAEPVDQLLGE